MEVAIKLSFLSQNWERLLTDMVSILLSLCNRRRYKFLFSFYPTKQVETVSAEVQDEAAYKRTKLAMIRTNKTPTTA